MTDETAAPPVVRRKRGRPKRTTPQAPKPMGSPYEGFSAISCANLCTSVRCVITHAAICGRSPLQFHQMMDPAAVRRKAEAQAFIAHKAVDKKAHR